MPFSMNELAGFPVESIPSGPPTPEEIDYYARHQVETLNVERRKSGLPDFEFVRVEGDSILMRDPMPTRYISGSHQIL